MDLRLSLDLGLAIREECSLFPLPRLLQLRVNLVACRLIRQVQINRSPLDLEDLLEILLLLLVSRYGTDYLST